VPVSSDARGRARHQLPALGMMALALSASLLGCSTAVSHDNSGVPTATVGTAGIVCSNEQNLSKFISDFLDAYNAGLPGLADRFFVPPQTFQWYSEPPSRLGDAAYERSTVEAYLQRRHADGDHLTLARIASIHVRAGKAGVGFFVDRGGDRTQVQSLGRL